MVIDRYRIRTVNPNHSGTEVCPKCYSTNYFCYILAGQLVACVENSLLNYFSTSGDLYMLFLISILALRICTPHSFDECVVSLMKQEENV